MRLPPPARRYSPISVMTATLETVSRPNSSSIATRSSRSRSKISFPLMAVVALKLYSPPRRQDRRRKIKKVNLGNLCASAVDPLSIRPVIRKLHIDSKVVLLHQGDDLLEGIAVLAADPHYVSLDGSLNFLLRFLNYLYDLFCLLNRDPLLHGDLLFRGAAGGRFDWSVGQTFQGHASFNQFLLKDVVDMFQFVLVRGVQDDRVFTFERDARLRILEVETGRDFFHRLLDRVRNFLQVNLADDIESVFGHSCSDVLRIRLSC